MKLSCLCLYGVKDGLFMMGGEDDYGKMIYICFQLIPLL